MDKVRHGRKPENKMNDIISIVIPCYNEQETILSLYDSIIKLINSMFLKYGVLFEVIFIDDGSIDNTLQIIENICAQDNRFGYQSFSRNFGKEAAIYAGLKTSRGDYVTLMDADLQDPPEMLENMYNQIKNNKIDCVAMRRISRIGEPLIRSFFANIFYKAMRKITKLNLADGERDFRIMTRQMVNSLISIGEKNRFSKGLFAWVGYKTRLIEYTNVTRKYGHTKWSFIKLFFYAIDGMIAFSSTPLTLVSTAGLIFCIFSMLLILLIVVRRLIWGDPVDGWASIVCIIIFMGGMQCFCTGILGTYISKIYTETKHRPLYIVKEQKLPSEMIDRNGEQNGLV